jgi:hypothetical protein
LGPAVVENVVNCCGTRIARANDRNVDLAWKVGRRAVVIQGMWSGSPEGRRGVLNGEQGRRHGLLFRKGLLFAKMSAECWRVQSVHSVENGPF